MTDVLDMPLENGEQFGAEINAEFNSNTLVTTDAAEIESEIKPIVDESKTDVEETKPDIDEKRRRRNVEYYGKRLTEIRNWLVDCLSEQDIPPAHELEEHLRSGILLARLANYFSPNIVPLDKIFDLNGTRFRNGGLHYRHTDNIIKWRKACQAIKLNAILLPDPSDIFAGRNIRTVFALLALAKRLHRYGKAPPLRECNELVLTDEAFDVIAERVDNAVETEGIDWENMQQECRTADSTDFTLDHTSLADHTLGADEIIEMPENSFQSLRYLCKSMNLSASIYDGDFLIEDQKMRLNKLLESNEALKVDLEELEGDIGLLVKNFRAIKDNSDKKAEQERKQEIEKAGQMQAFSTQNLSEDSVYDENNSTSSYEGDEPRSIAQVSRQTVESRSNDERIQRDLKLEAKAYILTLLNAGVSGSTIKDLVTSTDFISIDDTVHSKIAEAQNMLGLTLQKLVEQRQITDDGTYSDLLESVFWDVRNEAEAEQTRKERKEFIDKKMAEASKNAQDMLAQIDAYRKYEGTCLKNMTGGGTPSINLSEINKKVKKFLNRREKLVKRDPVKLSAEKLIKKKILYMDDTTTPKQVSKFTMLITPLEEPGHYKFEATLDGEVKHSQTIIFEDLLRREALGHFRMVFFEPLVLDCLGLRRYLDRKFHAKSFV